MHTRVSLSACVHACVSICLVTGSLSVNYTGAHMFSGCLVTGPDTGTTG